MTTLTVTSRNQGFGYNAAASVESFAIVEKMVGFAGALLAAARTIKLGGAQLRPVQA